MHVNVLVALLVWSRECEGLSKLRFGNELKISYIVQRSATKESENSSGSQSSRLDNLSLFVMHIPYQPIPKHDPAICGMVQRREVRYWQTTSERGRERERRHVAEREATRTAQKRLPTFSQRFSTAGVGEWFPHCGCSFKRVSPHYRTVTLYTYTSTYNSPHSRRIEHEQSAFRTPPPTATLWQYKKDSIIAQVMIPHD